MIVSVYVNTDTNMDQDMLDALTRFEFHCCMALRTEADSEEISAFLSDNYGTEMAARFKPNMMFRTQGISADQEL